MNKQKQIEELKKILCTPCAELVEEHDKIKNLPVIYAEAIYNAGYRKLPEDSIVLSREESQALKKQIEYWEYETKVAREEIDNAGKETAEKILNELIDSSNKITFFDCRMALGLDKLAKQFGVEVEE